MSPLLESSWLATSGWTELLLLLLLLLFVPAMGLSDSTCGRVAEEVVVIVGWVVGNEVVDPPPCKVAVIVVVVVVGGGVMGVDGDNSVVGAATDGLGGGNLSVLAEIVTESSLIAWV